MYESEELRVMGWMLIIIIQAKKKRISTGPINILNVEQDQV